MQKARQNKLQLQNELDQLNQEINTMQNSVTVKTTEYQGYKQKENKLQKKFSEARKFSSKYLRDYKRKKKRVEMQQV